MDIAPRTFSSDEPFDDVDDDLDVIFCALDACPLTKTLAPEIDQQIADLAPVRDTQTKLERAVNGEDAKIPFADDELNNVLDEVRKAVPAQLSAEEAEKVMGRLFEKYGVAELRRFTLSEQLEVQRGWNDILSLLGNPVLSALGARSAAAAKYADGVKSARKQAQTTLDTFMLGPRAAYIAGCNKTRNGIFGKVLEIAKDPANAPLPSDFLDRFFLRDTSGRVKKLGDVDKMIARLEAKLTKLKARQREMKKKQDDTARQKLQAKVDAKKAKLAGKQKGIDDEAAELATLEAELAKQPEE